MVTYGSDNIVFIHKDQDLVTRKIADVEKAFDKEFVNKLIAGTDGEYSWARLSDGRDMFITATAVKNVPWKIFVLLEQKPFYASMYATIFAEIGIMILVVIICLVLLNSYLSRKVLSPLNKLRYHMEDIAKGRTDLTSRLKIRTGDEIETLTNAFNEYLDHQQANVEYITTHLNSNLEIAGNSNELMKESAHNQNENVQSIFSKIECITGSAREIISAVESTVTNLEEISRDSQNGNGLVNVARENMSKLVNSIRQTQEAVNTVYEFSEKISALSENIRMIADQTNLLALNAAIESARAGEHGRGFAVVADEVRSLAVKTRESTELIKNTVDSFSANMKITINLVQNSSDDCDLSISNTAEAVKFIESITTKIENT